jgi:hypothetical protein
VLPNIGVEMSEQLRDSLSAPHSIIKAGAGLIHTFDRKTFLKRSCLGNYENKPSDELGDEAFH